MEKCTKTKTVIIEETYYISIDGVKFKTKKACQAYETKLKKHKCGYCGGEGHIQRQYDMFSPIDDFEYDEIVDIVCPMCGGVGYYIP